MFDAFADKLQLAAQRALTAFPRSAWERGKNLKPKAKDSFACAAVHTV